MSENKCFDIEQIRKMLPHRYPFLLVDRIISVSEDHVTALKNVSANEPFFNGHFPQMAVMPGVLQIEAMAQAGGIILAHDQSFDVNRQIAFLASVDDAKFKRVVVPGDQLLIEGEAVARRQNLLKIKASTKVDGQMASSATIVMVIKSLD